MTVPDAFTRSVVTGKVMLLLPVKTFTEAGTVAIFVFELESLIVNPGVVASPKSPTVPITAVFDPPTTSPGATEMDCNDAGLIVKTTTSVTVPRTAVNVTVVDFVTDFVAITNDAVEAPAAIFRVPGTIAAALSELKVTVRPPIGACPLRLTAPVALAPPPIGLGVAVKPTRAAG